MPKSVCTKEKPVEVRFTFPPDVHKKVKSHQRRLSATMDQDATMEEAIIDFVRNAKLESI